MYKQYMDELRAKRAANFEARNVQNCVKLWYAREACRKLSSIALEIYKHYVDELRANRAATFEARNVQNCVKLWYAREACRKLSSIALEMYKQYVDELRANQPYAQHTTPWPKRHIHQPTNPGTALVISFILLSSN